MFDIGFFELLILGVVGLLVIGPERLPETVRNIGLWIGRIKRSMRDVRQDIEQELGTDEVRRQLHNEEVMRSLGASKDEISKALHETSNTIRDPLSDIVGGDSIRNTAESRLDDDLDDHPNDEPSNTLNPDPVASNGSGHGDYNPDDDPNRAFIQPPFEPVAAHTEAAPNSTQASDTAASPTQKVSNHNAQKDHKA